MRLFEILSKDKKRRENLGVVVICTGFTEDLESRLKSHNQGNNPHTSKYRPWRVKTAIAFTDRQRAIDFESYLKSPSGRSFAKKRL